MANAVVLNEAPARIIAALPGWFDRVLVDAPCSGEGMFRKERRPCASTARRWCALRRAGRADIDAAVRRAAAGRAPCIPPAPLPPRRTRRRARFGAPRRVFHRALQRGPAARARPRCGEHPFCAQHTCRIYPCHGARAILWLCWKSAAAPWPGPGWRMPRARRPGRPEPKGRAGGTAAALAFLLREYFPQLGAGPEALQRLAAPCTCWRWAPFRTAQLRVVRRRRARGQRGKGPLRARARAVYGSGALCEKPRRAAARQPALRRMAAGEAIPAHTARAGWAAVTVGRACPWASARQAAAW